MIMQRACVVASLLLLAACSDGSGPPVPPSDDPAASLQIIPSSPTMDEHGTVTLTAEGRDAQGRVTTPRAVHWMSLDPEVAFASGDQDAATNMVRAVIPGEARIEARSDHGGDTVTVRVTPLPVDHFVVVRTLADTVLLHAQGYISAYPYAADGYPVTREVTYAASSSR